MPSNKSPDILVGVIQERGNASPGIIPKFSFRRNVSSILVNVSSNRSNSPGIQVSIIGIFIAELKSATQIGWTDFVSIDFSLLDFSAPQTVNLSSIEYSLDQGSTWNPLTLDPTHSSSTVTFPFTSTNQGNYTIVWNALQDLGKGKFGLVKIRMTLSAGSKTSTSETVLDYFQLFDGMGFQPPTPNGFKVINVDDDPIPKVDLQWEVVTGATLYNNIFHFNDFFARISDARYIFHHQRQVQGYSIYRGTNPSFSPPNEGVEVANTSVLNANSSSYTDQTVQQGTEYFYKIATVIS